MRGLSGLIGCSAAIIVGLTLLTVPTTAAQEYFSVKLESVSRIGTNEYAGEAGTNHLVTSTAECLHDIPEGGEWASFSWYGSGGMIVFASNRDICTVRQYTRSARASTVTTSASTPAVEHLGGETGATCTITIPAGAITNGEKLSLVAKQAWKSARGGDPPLMAFGRLGNDMSNARAFYDRISNTPAAQEDETLQIVDEDVLFGEALACRGDNCHLVFIRPVAQIAHHWLVLLQRHYQEFEDLASNTPEGAKFISDSKNADERPDSVWAKVSALYCRLEPDGKYSDLRNSVVLCGELRH